jgi:hypothetical protein
MKVSVFFYKVIPIAFLIITPFLSRGQFLMDRVDTTTEVGKGLFYIYKNYNHIRISSYLQPQYQVASSKGINSYSGGDFAPQSNNRFMFRRARIRFDYIHYTETEQPSLQIVFQVDGTERGVVIRDVWGRIFDNRWNLFSATTGMFARPFGFEVNLSSSNRETPERGRMSQILMKTERDLGAMVSLEPRIKNHPLRYLKIDAGVFNGQGMAAPEEFDSYKDLIGRVALKPYPISQNVQLSAGASYLNGGIYQATKYINRLGSGNDKNIYITDSSENNIGGKAPRIYHGADAQISLKSNLGDTEIRGEYWWGTQPSTANDPETPAKLTTDPLYIRNFDGAFFYFLQRYDKHQLGVKFDWYDPNTGISGEQIGASSSGTNFADIKFSTVSVGYNHYFNKNVKLFLWYDIVKNEKTSLTGYEDDVDDNVFTCRLQFEF